MKSGAEGEILRPGGKLLIS